MGPKGSIQGWIENYEVTMLLKFTFKGPIRHPNHFSATLFGHPSKLNTAKFSNLKVMQKLTISPRHITRFKPFLFTSRISLEMHEQHIWRRHKISGTIRPTISTKKRGLCIFPIVYLQVVISAITVLLEVECIEAELDEMADFSFDDESAVLVGAVLVGEARGLDGAWRGVGDNVTA